MENSTPFDLDQALSQWRASLQDLGGMRPEELEELESHLRESVSLLHARGLSLREAFTIANRRLGSEGQLSAEFAKANPQRLWTERAVWMLTGLLGSLALNAFAAPLSNFFLCFALWSGLNPHLAAALDFLAKLILWSGAVAAIFWILSRHSRRLGRVVKVCLQHPLPCGLGLFLGLECLQYGMRSVNRFAEPIYTFLTGHRVGPQPQVGENLAAWFIWGGLLTQLLWIAAGPLLAGYAWRKRGRPGAESPDAFELQPGEEEGARILQGQGLSLDEASLLLELRRSPHRVGGASRAPAEDKGIWLERMAWMVMGVAFSLCLDLFVVNLGWLFAVATQPVAPLAQHLTGLGCACLGLTLGCATVAALWDWVTRRPGRSSAIGKFCRVRPFVAALALVAVCVGIGLSEYALMISLRQLKLLPANNSLGQIASQYMAYNAAVIHLIIPITLLFWFARRWQGMQSNPAPCR